METPTKSTVEISAVQNFYGNIVLSHPTCVSMFPLLCGFYTHLTESTLRKCLLQMQQNKFRIGRF